MQDLCYGDREIELDFASGQLVVGNFASPKATVATEVIDINRVLLLPIRTYQFMYIENSIPIG